MQTHPANNSITTEPTLWRLVAFKTAYLVGVLAVVWLFGDFDVERFYNVKMRWPHAGSPTIASHFATWDAAHYL